MPSLQFKGKVFVENYHLAVPFHELKPVRSKGISKKASLHDNLIVEGDNLAALKALLPTYHGKVKCIYIDPPYNTGNESWIYNDNVNSPMMQDWLGKVVDREDLTRHDKWCCMMLPRLKLLRELLRDDGAIFISIDDNEVHHLRSLMDEVFGEDNFLACVSWEKRFTRSNNARMFTSVVDKLLIFRRSDSLNFMREPRNEKSDAIYDNPDDDPRGPWTSVSYVNPATRTQRPNLVYPVTNPITGAKVSHPTNAWKFGLAQHEKHVSEQLLWWGKKGNLRFPRLKKFLSEVSEGLVPVDLWQHMETGTTDEGSKELEQILGRAVFDNPKPTRLVARICRMVCGPDDIILDSFAGSGTTAHAVMALNKEDGGNRRFVLIECEDYVDSLTAERMRRVVKGIPSAKDESLKAGLGGTFSYFKLGLPMRQESLLDGSNLPSYEKLAGYVFFTATGEEFEPEKIRKETWFIGRSRLYDVFLIYEADVEKLKNMALTLDVARTLPRDQRNKLVFAPTKYLDREFLHRYHVTFQQLPFQIYDTIDKLAR